MDDTPDVSVESHEHNFKFSVDEKGRKASHSMEDNKLSLASEDFMEEPGHTQNIVCETEPLGAASVSIVGDSSIKGNESEKDDHAHDHLSADEKALQDMEGNKILFKVMGDDELSNVPSADKDLQDHSTEGKTVLCGVMGGNEPINIASVDLCAEAQTPIEVSVSDPEGFNIEKNGNEKDDHQSSCFVCPSSTEENRFCEINLEQNRMIAIQVASELGNNMENSLSNDEWVDGRDPTFEMARLGEDGETKAGAEDAVLELAANVSDEVQYADENKISDVTDCRGTFSGVIGCEEGKSILISKDFDTRDSGSPDVLMQPKAIQDKDTKHVLPVFNKKQCFVVQELHSEPEDEAPQDVAVGTATHVQKEEGDCPKTADNTQGANDLNTQCATEDIANSSISTSLLSTQDGSKGAEQVCHSPHLLIEREDIANSSISTSLLSTQDGSKGTEQVCHSSHLLIERGTCESGNENIPAERSLVGPEVASNELQDTVTQVKSEDDSASRSWEVRTCVVEAVVEDNASAGDAKSEDATASRSVEVLTCVVDNVVHNASAGDEDCFLAAGLSPSKICSPSSSVRSPLSQVRAMDDYSLNVQCSKDSTNAEVSSEVKSLCQTENGTASSECQLHGYFIDKDGGSSLDSRAGTGWKLQGDGGCVATEDEEASSTGGEDSASSPACIQPSAQQRKKINIHHQFVREIVKIQHDREQYDREHAERQIQAHQAANLVQLGGKNSDVKEHKSETRQVRSGTSNISSQKGLMDHGADRQAKELQQKHTTRNKKSSLIQAKDGSEQGKEPLLQGRDSVGAKEHGKTGRGKQQRSMSIYRPPIVRDTLAAVSHEQKNLGELESSYHQSGSYTQNSSPDSSMSSVSEPRGLSIGSPDLVNDEGTFRVVSSSSGECNTHSMETQAEENTPGMGIKVTFDTERKLRHIEFSDGPDLPKGQRQNERTSLVASGFGVSKSPMISPLLSHPFQDSKSSSLTSLNAGKRHAGIGETLTKGNDRYFTQADRSSWSQPTESSQSGGRVGKPSDNNVEKNTFFETLTKGNDRYVTQADRSSLLQPTESSQFRGRVGKPSDNNVEKKNIFSETLTKRNDRYFTQTDRSSLLQPTESAQSRGRVGKPSDNNVEKKSTFFEQADNSAILHNSSSWSHKSPSSLVRHGINNGLSGQNIHSNSLRHPDGHTGGMRMPSALLQGFSTPGSHKPASPGPSYKGELWVPTPFATSHVKSDEPNRTPVNRHASFQSQQLNVSRSQHDTKGKQRVASSTDGSKKKRDSQLRNSIKEAGSPFQAMMKDMNRPQVMFSSPAPQSSVDGSLDFQGLGMSWNTEDRTRVRTRNPDSSQESLKRSQSDASRRGSTQNLQAQLSPLPSRENVFCTMPMREKWGDIVDDLSDTYDYLQVKGEGERESRSGSLSYGVHNQSSAVFVDSSLKAEMPMLRDSKQDKAFRKYGYKEIDSLQRNQNVMHYQSKPSELVQEHSAYEIPVRKSVFERLGPQNNFRDSILGPPPKVLDSRGVLKASPDAFVSSVPPVSTYSSIDSGFHGSQQASHLSSTLHDSGDNMIDEGREVVVQAYTEMKQRRSKRELYVPRRGS